MPVGAPVCYISLRAEPVEPGPDRYGSGQMWVLHGAPSADAARAWAIAKFEARTWGKEIPQQIRECVVVPFEDELVSEQGRQPIDWLALPRLRDRRQGRQCGVRSGWDDDPFVNEGYSSGMVAAPNQAVIPGPISGARAGEITPEELRKMISPQASEYAALLNWDPVDLWYFIYRTPECATLVRSYNSFAASLLYINAVRGTPRGDNNATTDTWGELTFYSTGDPRREAQ